MTLDPIQAYKAQFEFKNDLIQLNNAGVTPWPAATHEKVRDWTDRLATEGTHAIPDAFAESEKTRALLGDVLGADASQIAFFQTCATAISQVALGLTFKPGDEIVVWDQEYPSNFFPWKIAAERSGAKLVIAKSGDELSTPLENIEKVVTARTRVIAVSWVQYRSGAITDLEKLSEFARARTIFTCIDSIQGTGFLPFDFNKLQIDAACGGSHKWFTSPHSLGFLILKPEHVERLTPLSVGAVTFGGTELLAAETTPMVKSVMRFEPGGRGLLEWIGFGETLKLIQRTGLDRISQEGEWLTRKLMHGLRERGYTIHSPHGSHMRGAILNFSPGPNAAAKTIPEIEGRLRNLKVSFATRPPGIRVSPHAYVTVEQIERVLAAL